jgi:hypothetical protein
MSRDLTKAGRLRGLPGWSAPHVRLKQENTGHAGPCGQHGLPRAEDFWVQKRQARRGSRALQAALGGGRFLPLQHYQVHGREGLEGQQPRPPQRSCGARRIERSPHKERRSPLLTAHGWRRNRDRPTLGEGGARRRRAGDCGREGRRRRGGLCGVGAEALRHACTERHSSASAPPPRPAVAGLGRSSAPHLVASHTVRWGAWRERLLIPEGQQA